MEGIGVGVKKGENGDVGFGVKLIEGFIDFVFALSQSYTRLGGGGNRRFGEREREERV